MGSYCKGIQIKKNFENYSGCLPVKKLKIIKAFRCDKSLERLNFDYNNYSKDLYKNKCKNKRSCYYTEINYTQYVEPSHGYILTGNFNIISNKDLKHYMMHGSKYRLKRIETKHFVFKQLTQDFDTFISKLARQ